ncbi:MAG: hypothetical protein IKT79_03060 [Akkermansia sp.]|nr:hypothetical protein [Akkermansia sp.]
MNMLAQMPGAAAPTLPQQESNLLQSIPQLESAIPVEALEGAGINPWLLWGGIGAGVILLAVAGLLLYRRFRKQQVSGISPEQIALLGLQELEEAGPDLRTTSLELSMILRRYLAGTAQDPALYETHEEFSRRFNSLSGISAEHRMSTKKLLEKLASYKYAGVQQDAPQVTQALIAETRQTILNLYAAKQQEEATSKEPAQLR